MSQTMQKTMDSVCIKTRSYIQPAWLEGLGRTRFLTRCRTGEISRKELHTFVEQHQLYSRHFTRYLAALLANMEDDEQRLALTRNLFDEMGLGEAGNMPHSKLYLNMMESLGLTAGHPPLPSTRHLNDTMFECCKSPSPMVGLGALCLGAEGIVPYIYGLIINGFLSVGVSINDLLFFTLHIECDDEHALTMNDIIGKNLRDNPNTLLDLNYGAEKMIKPRIGFFEGLSVR